MTEIKGAIITEDYEKAKCIIDDLKNKYSNNVIHRQIREKPENQVVLQLVDGSYVRWIKPLCEYKSFRYHKLWCDKSIANTEFFRRVILPCYIGKYEDIIWI